MMRIDALMPFCYRDPFDVAGFHGGESVATLRMVILERWAYIIHHPGGLRSPHSLRLPLIVIWGIPSSSRLS